MALSKAWGVYDKWLEDPRVKFYPEPRNLDGAFRKMTEPFAGDKSSRRLFFARVCERSSSHVGHLRPGARPVGPQIRTRSSHSRVIRAQNFFIADCNPSESRQYCAKSAQTARSDSDLLFPGPGGQPIGASSFTKNWFKPTLKKAGVSGFTIHDLRHTFGSLLLDAGAPLAYVSEQMGHASTVITAQIYIHNLRKNAGFVNRLDTQPAATKPS